MILIVYLSLISDSLNKYYCFEIAFCIIIYGYSTLNHHLAKIDNCS